MWESLSRTLAQRVATDLNEKSWPTKLLPAGGLIRAAVLVPLFDREGEPHVLLTLRPQALRQHAGQICLPGGRVEPGDRDAKATALREAQEEVGLDPAHVRVLGRLDEHPVVSGFRVTPWVAVVPHPYPYRTAPDEVAELLFVPLAELARPQEDRVEAHSYLGVSAQAVSYTVSGQIVWGATARVLRDLVGLWKGR